MQIVIGQEDEVQADVWEMVVTKTVTTPLITELLFSVSIVVMMKMVYHSILKKREDEYNSGCC